MMPCLSSPGYLISTRLWGNGFRHLLLVALTAVTMLMATPSNAKTFRLTPESAWAKLLASGSLQPGDEVVFAAGVYREPERVSIRQQGSRDQPIVIRAAEGAQVVFDAGPGGRNHHHYRNVLLIEGSQHLVIRGLELRGGSSGFRMRSHGGRQVEYVTIENCHIHHVGNCAVAANQPGDRFVGIVLRYNHVHHTAGVGEGFYLGANYGKSQFLDGLVEGNYIHDLQGPRVEQGDGIEVKDGSYHNTIRSNVIHDTQYPAIIVYGTGGKQPNIIEGNVMWNCQNHAIQAAADAIIRNNVIFGCKYDGIHSQNHDTAIPGNLTIVNNTIQAQGRAICVTQPKGGKLSGPVVIANNGLYSASGQAIELPDIPGFTLAANIGIGTATPRLSRQQWHEAGNLAKDFIGLARLDARLGPHSALAGVANPQYLPTHDLTGRLRGKTTDVGAHATGGVESQNARFPASFMNSPFYNQVHANQRLTTGP